MITRYSRLKKAFLYNIEVGKTLPFDGGKVKVHYISNNGNLLNQTFLDSDNPNRSIEYSIQYLDGPYTGQWSTYTEDYLASFLHPEDEFDHVVNNLEEFLNDKDNW